jgi:HPt (histidine-containing phosphotransfer) domain-containing protein
MAAHALKGSAATICAERVCHWAAQLESMGRARDLSGTRVALAGLKTAVEELLPALRSAVASSANAAD